MTEFEKAIIRDYKIMLSNPHYLRLAKKITIFDSFDGELYEAFSIESKDWDLPLDEIESIISKHGFVNVRTLEV